MSGVTDTAFRQLVKMASGDSVGLLFTEFVCTEALTRNNLRTVMRLHFQAAVERPICVQIFGGSVTRMADAAEMAVDAGADMVDVNCGCPAPKVVKRGGGADLHRDVPRMARILEAVRARVRVPLSMKMRTGWDDQSINAVEMARVGVDCGVDMVSVHGRTRVQRYTGQADWDVVRQVVEAVPVPVMGSGDVVDPASAAARLRESGCAGLLIGRAAIMNPWIFKEIDCAMRGVPFVPASLRERLDLLYAYADLLAGYLPGKAIPGRVKMVVKRFSKGLPDGARLRHSVLTGDDLSAIFGRIEEYFADLQARGHDEPAPDQLRRPGAWIGCAPPQMAGSH